MKDIQKKALRALGAETGRGRRPSLEKPPKDVSPEDWARALEAMSPVARELVRANVEVGAPAPKGAKPQAITTLSPVEFDVLKFLDEDDCSKGYAPSAVFTGAKRVVAAVKTPAFDARPNTLAALLVQAIELAEHPEAERRPKNWGTNARLVASVQDAAKALISFRKKPTKPAFAIRVALWLEFLYRDAGKDGEKEIPT